MALYLQRIVSEVTSANEQKQRTSNITEFRLVTRRLWVQLPAMPLRSNPGQVAYMSFFYASDLFTKEYQPACYKIIFLKKSMYIEEFEADKIGQMPATQHHKAVNV